MSKYIQGVHHISLKPVGVEGFEKTVSFYRDVLGMPIVRSWGEGTRQGAMLDTGNSVMEITANGTEEGGSGSLRHLALATNNVDAIVEDVRAAGYKIIIEPRDAQLPTNPPLSIRIAFCIGPCGEELEFFQEK
jgi:glyoxylase I family protein